MPTENLSIRVSGRTSRVRTALGRLRESIQSVGRSSATTAASMSGMGESADDARDDALQLAFAMYTLADASDEVGDEMRSAAASMFAASGSMSGMTASSTAASGAMSTLGVRTTVVATAVGGLVAILPAAIALLGALTAAAGGLAIGTGAVIGTGALAAGLDTLKEDLQIVRENIESTAAAAGEEFAPMIRTATRAIDDVFVESLARIRPMFSDIASGLREAGTIARRAIPRAVEGLTRLGVEAMPILLDGLRFLERVGPQALRAMVQATRDMGPELIQAGLAFAEFAPAILDASVALSEHLLPMLTRAFRAGAMLHGVFKDISREAQNLPGADIAGQLGQVTDIPGVGLMGPMFPLRGVEVAGELADRLTGGGGGGGGGSTTGADSRTSRQTAWQRRLQSLMNEVANNTSEETQASATRRGLERGADALCAGILGPFERAPRPRTGGADGGLTPAERGAQRADIPENITGFGGTGTGEGVVVLDGKKVGEFTEESAGRFGGSFVMLRP